jgi:predicted amidophosphoribosyltransferase
MPACSNCGKDTELYYHGLPFCADCSRPGVFLAHVLPDREEEEEENDSEVNSEVPRKETPSE